jgi:DNA-binding transcriptional LysR family regulator
VADLLIELCKSAGFVPQIHGECDDMQGAAFMASLSQGVALVAASLQNMNTPNLVYRPVLQGGEPVTMPLYLVRREADASESVRRIIAHASGNM